MGSAALMDVLTSVLIEIYTLSLLKRLLRDTITLYLLKRLLRDTITLYLLKRLLRDTITLCRTSHWSFQRRLDIFIHLRCQVKKV